MAAHGRVAEAEILKASTSGVRVELHGKLVPNFVLRRSGISSSAKASAFDFVAETPSALDRIGHAPESFRPGHSQRTDTRHTPTYNAQRFP
jgi:hypothetical protein